MVCFDAYFLISDSHRESLFYILNNDSDRYFRGSRCISLLNISLSKCTISGDLRWRFKIMHLFQVIPSEIFSRTSEIAKCFFHFFVLKNQVKFVKEEGHLQSTSLRNKIRLYSILCNKEKYSIWKKRCQCLFTAHELNWSATTRPIYTTRSLVAHVSVTAWLPAAKLGRLVLGQFVLRNLRSWNRSISVCVV